MDRLGDILTHFNVTSWDDLTLETKTNLCHNLLRYSSPGGPNMTHYFNCSGFSMHHPIRPRWVRGYRIMMAVIVLFLCLVGLILNTFIIATLVRYKMLRTGQNIIILNMALAGILLQSFTGTPIFLDRFLLTGWVYGETMCKLLPYLLLVLEYIQCYTTVYLCISQCLRLFCPFNAEKWEGPRTTWIVCIAVWVLITLLHSWYATGFEYRLREGKEYCYNTNLEASKEKRFGFFVVTFLLLLIFPLLTMSCSVAIILCRLQSSTSDSYRGLDAQDRHEIRRELLVSLFLLLVFVAFSLPYNIMALFWHFTDTGSQGPVITLETLEGFQLSRPTVYASVLVYFIPGIRQHVPCCENQNKTAPEISHRESLTEGYATRYCDGAISLEAAHWQPGTHQ